MDETEMVATPLRDPGNGMTRPSGDPRAARTRRAIIDAARALVADGVLAPGVSDIVRRAGISRSSFYMHFANTDDLAVAVFQQAFSEIEDSGQVLGLARTVSTEQVVRSVAERLVRHVHQHREFYRLSLQAAYAGHHKAVDELAAHLSQTIPLVAVVPAGVSVGAAARYIAAGNLAVLRAWVIGELPGSVGDITNQIVAMLPAWLVSPDPLPPDPGEAGKS